MVNNKVTQIIAANPKACYRTLYNMLDSAGLADYEPLLAAARPNCGYSCDGDDGPDPDTGITGCPVSGRCEP